MPAEVHNPNNVPSAIVWETGAAPTLDRFLQDATPEPNPFDDTDTANINLINAQIEAELEDEFTLTSPRLTLLGHLNIQPLAPDVGFGVLADANGIPYAIVYNHDMDCIEDPLAEAGYLGEAEILDGPARGTVLDPGVTEIEITSVDPEFRLGSMVVERFRDEQKITVAGVEITLPVLVIKGFEMGEEFYDCPTVVEKLGETLGGLVERVQEGVGSIQFGEILESVGEFVGEGIDRLRNGLERGLND